jgi:purine-cytosine permease-like protein
MSKYSSAHRREFKRPYKIHPIWRGIGLMIMILIPIIAWFGAVELVKISQASEVIEVQRFTRGLSAPFKFPDWFMAAPVLSDIGRWMRSIPMLKLKLVYFFMIALVLSGVLSIIYGLIYRAAVPRYAPLDEPAPKVRAKKYTR